MRTLQATALVALLFSMFFMNGCSTPASRIRQNQALFDSFPAEVQANLRAGKVEIGYSRPMVDIALGEPDRTYTRRTQKAEVTVLAYTAFESRLDRQRVEANFRFRDSGGAYRSGRDWVWVDVEHRNEYDRMRIELTGDRVTAIETADR